MQLYQLIKIILQQPVLINKVVTLLIQQKTLIKQRRIQKLIVLGLQQLHQLRIIKMIRKEITLQNKQQNKKKYENQKVLTEVHRNILLKKMQMVKLFQKHIK